MRSMRVGEQSAAEPAGGHARRATRPLLARRCRQLPEADLVQHDALWRQRLDGWLRFGGRVAWVLAALLGLGALLVVGNTVRLDIQSRREEIGVLQLLGATDGFIRRPFLYLGAWYGLAAGVLALGLLTAAATRAARAARRTGAQLRQPLRAARLRPASARRRSCWRRRCSAGSARPGHRTFPASDPSDRHLSHGTAIFAISSATRRASWSSTARSWCAS